MLLSLARVRIADGVETQVLQRSLRDKKTITYLEAIAEFAELADEIPVATYLEALSISLAELPNVEQNFVDLHQAWLTGRIEEVERVVTRSAVFQIPQIASRIVDVRNERWIPKILAATNSERRTLIVVGAMHLPRENGLLAMLHRAGHRVQLVT